VGRTGEEYAQGLVISSGAEVVDDNDVAARVHMYDGEQPTSKRLLDLDL
jgi:hypothetical protein